jgi:hypothetical protein
MQFKNEIQIHPQLGLDLIIAASQLRFISLQPAAEGNAVARLAYGPKRAPKYLLISKPRRLPAPTPGASLHTRPSPQCPHLLPTYPTTQPQSTDTCVLTASESTNYLGKWPRAERQLAGGYIQDPFVASPTAAVADFREIRNWKFVRTCTGWQEPVELLAAPQISDEFKDFQTGLRSTLTDFPEYQSTISPRNRISTKTHDALQVLARQAENVGCREMDEELEQKISAVLNATLLLFLRDTLQIRMDRVTDEQATTNHYCVLATG